jgi:NADH:ubiquinone oxidoreductase subunit E
MKGRALRENLCALPLKIGSAYRNDDRQRQLRSCKSVPCGMKGASAVFAFVQPEIQASGELRIDLKQRER